ncbi:MAG: relaxase/mobilization nuclease domain-containing protein, partial [Gemmatimonadales bacterium]|nr:relaxase/mobilization nuclease domain-containing protein [Gemmatimonadales bacterium]
MHIKFLARGTGSARAAAKYLLGERDAAGKPREGVEVLRGDPHRVASVADTLGFEHRYTSGVIAWAPEDAPTDEQIGAVLDAFEKTAWAGLEPDRYAWAAVLHREEGGGAHVHVLAARCDLETGRSLNIAPPGWRRTFDPLRDAFNHEHGWGRPDDPARA